MAGPEGNKIDILLVDDRPDNLLALEVALEACDYNLIKANSGEEALRYLLENDCAIILLDVQMPGMDGFETASYIKKNERSRSIPIIFLTAINKDDRFVYQGYRSGAVDYIFKPVEPEVLRAKVAVFADLYRARTKIQEQSELLRSAERAERDRALAQLELSSLRREKAVQTKYRELVEGIDHGIIWSLDPLTFSTRFVSARAEHILGYPMTDWHISWDSFFLSQVFEGDRAFVRSKFEEATNARKALNFEHRFTSASGAVVWVQTGVRLGLTEDGHGEELRGLSVDITKMKQTEQALRKSEEQLRFLSEVSALLMESRDQSETLQQMVALGTERLADVFYVNITPGDLMVSGIGPYAGTREEASSSLYVDSITHFLKTVAAAAEDQASRLLSRVYRDPEIPNVSTLVRIPLVARDRKYGVVCVGYFVNGRAFEESDLQMAEALGRRVAQAFDNIRLFREAQNAIRVRDEFLSIASHELKTPITPLKINTQILARALKWETLGAIPAEKLDRMLSSTERQLSRLSRLVDDLLDISRINIGRLVLNLEHFQLRDLVSDVIERFGAEVAGCDSTVKFTSSAAAEGEWDRFRIEQVIINLLTNAVKYGLGSPVHVHLSERDGDVRLSVRDYGIGIARADQNRIFDRFERAVSANNFGGLGLGLYIVKEIVSAHNGSIAVRSTLGKGALFLVHLPLTPRAPLDLEQKPLALANDNALFAEANILQ